ncbi:hypothetical protein QVD17_17859 [Tagetes erecta]|uniref:RRM domain-containing protein n=1 Tax=Tagetes erecta TaxID=13708 RepID=A0AAD8KK37_TARER|nr:hypothetical protein QVD17_17859 [Tagetes erecta]
MSEPTEKTNQKIHEDKDGWETKESKSRRKDRKKNKYWNNITSFFVSNFPKNITSWDLRNACYNLGHLTDAFIPNKKNNFGERFGFVRYRNVKDVFMLEKGLNNMVLGGLKLSANLAKFDKNGNRLDYNYQPSPKGGDYVPPPEKPPQHSNYVPKTPLNTFNAGRSFKDSLLGNNQTLILSKKESIALKNWSGYSVIGEVLCLSTLNNLKTLLEELKIGAIEIRYLWGLRVLISFGSSVEAKRFVAGDVGKSLFANVEIWKGQVIPNDRLAWVQIRGVPLHLWDPSSFNMIGQRLGRLVHQSEASIEDGNLSLDQVGIIVHQQSRVEGQLWIECDGQKFLIGFREIDNCWAPDFVNNMKRCYLQVFRPITPTCNASPVKSSSACDPASTSQPPPSCHPSPMHTSNEVNEITIPHDALNVGTSLNNSSFLSGCDNGSFTHNINSDDPFGINDFIFKSLAHPKNKRKAKFKHTGSTSKGHFDSARSKKIYKKRKQLVIEQIFGDSEILGDDSVMNNNSPLYQANPSPAIPQSQSGLDEPATPSTDSLLQEAEMTVNVGSIIGMDLTNFVPQVKEIIQEEGVNNIS